VKVNGLSRFTLRIVPQYCTVQHDDDKFGRGGCVPVLSRKFTKDYRLSYMDAQSNRGCRKSVCVCVCV
jgi:hypothetical protein